MSVLTHIFWVKHVKRDKTLIFRILTGWLAKAWGMSLPRAVPHGFSRHHNDVFVTQHDNLGCQVHGSAEQVQGLSCILTHLPMDKTAVNSQTIFSDGFSWMKSFVFWLKCHWKFVPKRTIDIDPALVWIMAWHRIGDKPLSEPKLTWFTDAYMWH